MGLRQEASSLYSGVSSPVTPALVLENSQKFRRFT